ncbi:MAG: hypothetical protein RID18_05580 [Cytophagales bacterium]
MKSGTYRIIWIKNGNPQKIRRFLGDDPTGLVYIGRTKGSLLTRLKQFGASAFLGSSNHSAGNKYKRYKVLNSHVKPSELKVEFKVESPNKAVNSEKAQIKKYAKHFGEVPPLNG